MKVITEPKVSVVGVMRFVEHPEYKIPPDGDDAIRLCAFAAKGCYDSYGEEGRANTDNQSHIVEVGHGSVLEHFHISLFIEGITRGLSLELNRHRHFNVSQRSTRYTDEGDCAIVLDPYYAKIWSNPDSSFFENTLVQDHVNKCRKAIGWYDTEVDRLLDLNPNNLKGTALRKWARGKARNLLPHALETRGTWTGNLRTWRHFLEMRSDRHAEAEIRRLAGHVYDAIQPVAPLYFQDYTMWNIDGLREFSTEYRKV